MKQSEQELRATVALCGRILAAHGHDDFIWGHLSMRDPDGRGVWMKTATVGLEETSERDVILVSFEGEVLDGDGRRHVEWPIHTEIYTARPDVGAVVHSHAQYSVAVAAAGQPLRPVSHAATLFVPPDVPRFTTTSDLIATREMGQAVAATLGHESALFLVNHGLVTAGRDAADAVVRAVLLEKAAQHQVLTTAAGGPRIWTSDEDALAKRATTWSQAHLEMLWDYLVRSAPPPRAAH